MKMKKKRLVVSMIAALVVFAGCGKANDQAEPAATEKNEEVTIYLTRHGETMFNVLGKVQGWSDTPLTEEGEQVAIDLGKGLKGEITFDSAYSSDLKRAYDTGVAVLNGIGQEDIDVQQLEGLRESSCGQFEGELLKTVGDTQVAQTEYKDYEAYEKAIRKEGEDNWSWFANAHYHADQSGFAEKPETVKKRMKEAITEIAEEQSKNGGGNVLVVSHGMSINIMLSDMTDKYTGESLKNASVTKIHYKDGQLDVESIGDMSYLDKAEKE
ncbi:hypothetical protein A5888_004154 [Enterococcus sp. 9E7_DIV0242]|uniref:Phosphoglycerate mutase n=2 Tax=Candidatus Enterococcus clewellii TaxID=1834193 RepID=A0A242K6W8_9ENTE|nr:hypothetical protein A5888_002275 [Enterococcus sp. 9E7_DIV0242]